MYCVYYFNKYNLKYVLKKSFFFFNFLSKFLLEKKVIENVIYVKNVFEKVII